MTPLMPLGSMFRDFSAGSELAPQSRRRSRPAASMRKQVLSRPPEPKASPDRQLHAMALGRAATCACQHRTYGQCKLAAMANWQSERHGLLTQRASRSFHYL